MYAHNLPSVGYRALLVGALCLCPQTAWADAAPRDRPVGWNDWNFDPVIILNLSLLAWLYARGLISLQTSVNERELRLPGLAIRRHPNRKTLLSSHVTPVSTIAFATGFSLLAISLLSPIDPLGGQLSWVHMIQHMLVMTVAVPLMLLGAPGLVCLLGVPTVSRKWVLRGKRWVDRAIPWLWSAGVAWSVYAAATWIWHLPALYNAALRTQIAHDFQHLSFFLAAWLFWRPLLDRRRRNSMPAGMAVLYLLTTTLHVTVLGVLMTVAPDPWYAEYADTTRLWGWSPLEDQQMAGLIMWMPACLPYLVVAVWLFAKEISQPANPVTPPKLSANFEQ